MTTWTPPEPTTPHGAHHGYDEDTYHGDSGALSQTGMKLLLDCPARYVHAATTPQAPKRAYDMGTAVHHRLLGVGPDLVAVDAPDWRTKKARDAADAAREAGGVPLLTHEMDTVEAVTAAVRAHPLAAEYLDAPGDPEVTLRWDDEETGTPLRARVDRILYGWDDAPSMILDVKTAADASPHGFGRKSLDLGYHVQAAHYRNGVRAVYGLDPQEPLPVVFLVVEKTAPHLVTVGELDARSVAYGERQVREALEVWGECVASGVWPGYGDGQLVFPAPSWLV